MPSEIYSLVPTNNSATPRLCRINYLIGTKNNYERKFIIRVNWMTQLLVN